MELVLEAVVIGNMESVPYIRSQTNLWQSDNSSLSSQNASSCGSTNQGVVTCMSRVEAFATGIKTESSDQSPLGGPIKGSR